MTDNKVTIIGGGLAGSSIAAQLCQHAKEPLDILIIEPRPELGAGVAYSADDPDHRLNAPLFVHFITPEKAEDFQRWFIEGDHLKHDPDALSSDGNIYARRREFAHYVVEFMDRLIKTNPSNSTITHRQDSALEISATKDGYRIFTKAGGEIETNCVALATGNQSPSAPPPFDKMMTKHPAFYKSPWELEKIWDIKQEAEVLIIGAGLTMSDVTATLMRQGHSGNITAVSRRGMLPQTHAKPPADAPPRKPFEGIMADKPLHINGNLLKIFSDLRKRMKADMAKGGEWHWAFDELRDSVWQIWPGLSDSDQRQYLRHLRQWYDSHRFRMPPQTAEILDDALAKGILKYKSGHIFSASDHGSQISVQFQERRAGSSEVFHFDAIINCTGPSQNPNASQNPFYLSIINQGLARGHATHLGFDVDRHNRAIGKDGEIKENLFIAGPPTIGSCGDPIGGPFIAAQISRMVPKILAALQTERPL